MRKKIVAGNWKMNLSIDQAKELILGINRYGITHTLQSEVVVCPPSLYVKFASETFHHNKVQTGAQNLSEYENGAYTGEISASMLQSLEVDYVLIGHSERRQYFGETDEMVSKKAKLAIANNVKPIVCIGETLQERKAGNYFDVIKKQLKAILSFSEEEFQNIVIAYEPVWAIGTGETASPEQAQEVHEFIRKSISDAFGVDVAENTSIVYGGSVKAENAFELFSKNDIDGGLIGGASLNLRDFTDIINALERTQN